MANAPQPDYSAAWAQYYAHQAANAQAQAQGAPTAGPVAPTPGPPPAQAYGQPSQQPYSYPQPAGPSYPGPQSYAPGQSAYQVRPSYPQQPPHHHQQQQQHPHHQQQQPQHQQHQPPYRSQQPPPLPPSLPSVGPQAYPSQAPYGSPNQPYQIGASSGGGGGAGRYPSGQGPSSVSVGGGGGGGGSNYHPSVRPSPMSAPHHLSNSSSMTGGSGAGGGGPGGSSGGFNQPAGFPPAKRPRFDSHSAGGAPGGGLSPAPVPGLPLNPLITAAVVNAERAYNARESGSEFFSGGDGRDGLSMGMASRGTTYRGRGTVSRGGSTRGGYLGSSSSSGGIQDDDDYSGGASSYRGRGRGRGISRNSPPPMGMAMGSGMAMGMGMNGGLPMSGGGRGGVGISNGLGSGMRGDRGGYRGRGMRGAAYSSSHPRADYAPHDAPRGPSSTRYHARASLGNAPLKKDTPTGTPVVPRAKVAKEDGPKQTFTDFKIVGLEVPELSWKWGVVDREDEVEGGNGRKRKADAGSEDPNQGSPTQASTTGQPPSKHRSYFKTHGKANPDRIEEVSKEISRLRLYFDSPAGAGPGESKRRGGIEGGERKQSAPKRENTPSVTSTLTPASAGAVSASATALSAPSSNAGETEEEQKEEPTEPEPEHEEEDESAKDSTSNIDGEEIEDLSMRGSVEPEVEPSTSEKPLTAVPTEAATEPEVQTESQTDAQDKPTSVETTAAEEKSSEVANDQVSGTNEPQETDGNEEESSEVLALLQNPQSEDSASAEQPSVSKSEEENSQQEQTPTSAPTLPPAPSTVDTTTSTATATSAPPPSEEPQQDIPVSAPSPTKLPQDTPQAPSKASNTTVTSTSSSTPTSGESTKPGPTLYTGPEPSPDRVSILYERCTRRLCIDAGVIERVRISRAEGKVEFTIRWRKGLEQEKVGQEKVGQEKIKEEEDTTASTTEAVADPADEIPPKVKVEEVEGDVPAKSEVDEATVPTENGDEKDNATTAAAADSTLPEIKTETVEKDEQPVEPVKEEKSTPAPTEDKPTEKPSENGAKSEEPKDDRVWDICRGILMELLEEETDHFQPVVLETLEDMWDEVEDPCAGWTPPIHKLIAPDSPPSAQFPTLKTDTFKIIAYLDQEKPLSEPKWVKAGKAEEFLSDTFGPSSNGHAKDWRGHKFEVLDPEEAPVAPTIHTSLDSWATNSTVGTARERRRFVKLHLVEMDRISDILLRVVNPSTSTSSAASSAMGQSVSTAVSAVLKMAVEMAVKAGVSTETVNDRVAEIIRALPQQVLFRGVDSLFKEWLADKRP